MDEFFIKSEDFRRIIVDNYGGVLELQWESAAEYDPIAGLGEQNLLVVLNRVFRVGISKTSLEVKELLFDDMEMSNEYISNWDRNRSAIFYKKIAELLGNDDVYVASIIVNKENLDDKGLPKDGYVLIWLFLGKTSE